jgi:hypothetical protein
MGELLDLVIKDRSRAVRERLNAVEAQIEQARDQAAELNKRRDSMTSTSVRRKLDNISTALSQSPLNISEANRVLKQALRKMVMRPAQGRLELHWHHSDETQEVGLYTGKLWNAKAS